MDTSKIIKGVVSNGRYTVTAPIVKEDYGLYLQIEGVELPSTYQVDFSNDEHHGTSVTMIGNSDGVLIPHQFIDTGKDIFAFLYHVGANYGRTVFKFRIPNKLRPDRTDEQPTPEEQSVIDQAISALNEAVAQTAQDKADADASAQSAKEDADRAEQARDDASTFAQRSANSAQASADYSESAQASATASANSASASAQIKADVESLAEDAQGYAQASAQSASQASARATMAQNYADNAQGYANLASDHARTASQSALDAQVSASQAEQSAQTASQKATESAQSASQALTYKTDAESAKVASQTAQGLSESARDSAISAKTDAESAKADAESARDEAQSIVDGISGALDDKAPVITDTASGAVASFTDGADDLPLKSLVVDINPVQDLHGYDSPWVAGGGKNKINAPDVTISSGSYLYNGALALPAGTYTISFTSSSGASTSASLSITDADGTAMVTGGHVIPYTFTLPNASANVKIYVSGAGTYTNIQLEEGSTATAYAPYENICPISGWTGMQLNANGTVIPISWQAEAGTVYGGKLDVLSGELIVDRAIVDLGTLSNWRYNVGSTGAFDTRVALTPLAKSNTKCICSQYKTLDYPNQGNITKSDFCVGINKKDDGTGYTGTYVVGTLFVKDIRYSNVEAFKTAMSGVMLCYELAEPIEIQLTPNQVNSLLGVNNIWADTGDTTCEYRADTKLFIERLTAPDSADMIADANITSGQYFMVGNSLYKATANIANGGQITVGTNCTRVSLAQALNEINA